MNFDQLPAGFWALLIPTWFLASIIYRRIFTKPLVATKLKNAIFSEKWTSARAGSGLLARMSTTRNCIHVQVTPTELRINPHFPFTLGFMPEVYNLDHIIPLQKVVLATIQSDGRAKAVEVRYATHDGHVGTVQLLLSKAEAFIQALDTRKSDA